MGQFIHYSQGISPYSCTILHDSNTILLYTYGQLARFCLNYVTVKLAKDQQIMIVV